MSSAILLSELRRNREAVSPAISTVILTSAVIVMLLVTVSFADNFLNARMAENEFNTVKQFMQTAALQIDDVGWTIGRTQTIRYSSKFGEMRFESGALNYSIFFNDHTIADIKNSTGIILFNMPISKYTLGNGYNQRILPPSNSSFLQKGTSALVCHVFVVEKLPMNDGNYIRVVAAPSFRMLNSTITTNGTTRNYYKLFLPVLNQGNHPRLSQSVTLIGTSVDAQTTTNVNKVKIHVDFPRGQSGLGFDSNFFKFDHLDEEVNVPAGSVIEFYTGEVIVSLGLHA